MPESTEPAPENNKAKQTAYLVCDGALCQCDAGAAPVKLKVDSHKKAYINDNKLLATVKDIKFELPTAPFSTCKNIPSQNKTCQPKFEKWTKPYKDIEVEGNQVITDKSELLCMAYGGKVTITMHGQQQTVNAGQAENMDRAIAAQVNPLADLAPLAEADKKVAVKSIKGELVDDPKYKSVTSQKIEVSQSVNKDDLVKRKDDLVDIYVRPGQEVKFTADYVKGGTPELVCWKTNGVKGPIHFLQHGPIYKTSFPEVGKYTIEGYGTNGDNNLDIDTKIVEDEKKKTKGSEKRLDDRTCMLDIVVQVNKLNGIRHIESANVIKGKTEAHVRIGVPVTFEPVYLMAPIQEEIDHLILVIKDASGNEVQRSKGVPNIVFAAQNSAANYKVEAYFDNSEAAPFAYPFRTAHNTVSVIAASGMQTENDKIRPGKELTFSVKESRFSEETVDEELVAVEHEKMKWYENSLTPVATGTTYTKTYHKEAEYVVKCAVTTVEKTWFTNGKNEADDWRFEVTKNYPTAIEQKTEGKVKVGKKITFELKGIFAIDSSDAATITWQLTGPETITTTRSYAFVFTPRKNGSYKLTAAMNGQSKDFDFECMTCEIVKGWWTDADGNILTGKDDEEEPKNTIGFAGWGQEVVAAFKHIGLNGEDVTLEVFQKNNVFADVSVFKKDVRVMGTGNGATCSVKLDASIKDVIKKNSVIGSTNALLYFTVKAKNGLKVINDGMTLPDSHNYLNVDSKVRIKTYFADNNDTRRYSTASLDTPVYIQVKSTNLIGEELELEIWKSIDWELDKALGSRFTFKVDKYGMASLKLNMKLIKPELPTPKDSVGIYVKIYNKNTRTELTGEFTFKLTMYKTLATSASSIGTTKAFVVVGSSENSTNQICECNKNDLIWGDKVSCGFRKKIIEITKELWPNKYKEMANGLMAVINVETSGTFSASKIELLTFVDSKGKTRRKYQGLSNDEINKLDDNFKGAVGLIQFIQESIDAINKAHSLNLTKKKLALMSDIEQLDYVKKYLMLYGWHTKLVSPEDIYLHVFAPIGIAKDNDFVLYKAYDEPKTKNEIENNKNYLANKSVDEENNSDKSIQRFEILGRYNINYTQGLSSKEKNFSCGISKNKVDDIESTGVLFDMKTLVDKHIAYSQLGVRNDLSEKGLLGLDCSETIAIYLYKLGITQEVKEINTGLMTKEKDFRLAINSENIDFIAGSDSETFKPIRGDIFVWRTSDGGHTGIVYEYNENDDLVTILEAIGSIGSADETTNTNNGGYSGKGCSRTAVYKRSGNALYGHAGWIGYFRPKKYSQKL